MENYQLTSEEFERFQTDGYLVIEPNRIFSDKEIEVLRNESLSLFPTWEEGNSEPKGGKPIYTLTGPVRNYSQVSNLKKLRQNRLFAKRASIIAPFFSQTLVNALENPRLLEFNKKLLKCDSLSLHNSAIACVYPGRVCEPRMMHVDTPGFSYRALEAVKNKHFVLNSFIYLVDVDETNAPLRVIPGSANRFLEINKSVAKYFRSTEDDMNIGQLNLYEEMFPSDLKKPVLITGKAGTITLMSGSLLHSATPNINDERSRLTFTVNYSCRNDPYFFKDYSIYAKSCAAFISKFKDKGIPKVTYYSNSSSPVYKIKKVLKKYKAKALSSIRPEKVKKEIVYSPEYAIKLAPWNKEQQIGNGKISIFAANLLKFSRPEAEKMFSEFVKSRTSESRFILAVPNANQFIKSYYDKDYVFFRNLPLTNYFLEESLIRYVIRYFSAIASSFAQDDELLKCIDKNSEIFFKNLEDLENKILNSNVDLSFLEKDIAQSRWLASDLSALFQNNNLKEVLPTEEELTTVQKSLGAEPQAWLVLAGKN